MCPAAQISHLYLYIALLLTTLAWCTLWLCAELPKLTAWCEAASSHPAVQGSMQPPDASKSYMEQLKEVYVEYISRRKAAAAAAP